MLRPVRNPTLFQHMNVDPLEDFGPVALAAPVPIVLAVNPQARATTAAGLIALARPGPGPVSGEAFGTFLKAEHAAAHRQAAEAGHERRARGGRRLLPDKT